MQHVAVDPAPRQRERTGEPAPSASPPTTPGPNSTSGQHGSALPRALLALTVLHVLLLLCYSVMVPTFRARDEDAHVDLVRHLARTAGYPDVGELSVSASIVAARGTSPAYQAGGRPVGLGDAVPADARPTFPEAAPDVPTEIANPMPQHPPLYYALGAALFGAADVVLPGWPWPFDRTVALLRLFNVALVAALPVLAWATARRLGCPARASLAAAVLVLAVPQLTHVGSVVTNDDLLVVLSGGLFLLAARVVTGDLSRRTAIVAGVVVGLALLTRVFALVLAPWIVAAYLFAPGALRRRRLMVGRMGLVAVVGMVMGGWWWARNLVVHGALQPDLGLSDPAVPGLEPGSGFFLATFAERLFGGFWGSFGWSEVALAGPAIALSTLAVTAAVAVAFVRGRTVAVRARLAYFMFPPTALLVVAAVSSLLAYLETGTFGAQGRYLLPALVGLVVVAAVGFDQVTSRRTASLPLLAFVGAVAMQVLAVGSIMSRYWAGGASLEGLRSMLAFSPWPPAVVFVGAVVTLAVAGWAARELVRCWMQERRGAPSG